MCYSAKIQANYREYVRRYGADMNIETFQCLYFARASAEYQQHRMSEFETELFAQRARLAAAERKLQVKVTKSASEDVRIATDKIAAAQRGLDDLRRRELKDSDSRIFPGWYAPVLIEQDGQRLIVPMRYRCRCRAGPMRTSGPSRQLITPVRAGSIPHGARCLASRTGRS